MIHVALNRLPICLIPWDSESALLTDLWRKKQPEHQHQYSLLCQSFPTYAQGLAVSFTSVWDLISIEIRSPIALKRVLLLFPDYSWKISHHKSLQGCCWTPLLSIYIGRFLYSVFSCYMFLVQQLIYVGQLMPVIPNELLSDWVISIFSLSWIICVILSNFYRTFYRLSVLIILLITSLLKFSYSSISLLKILFYSCYYCFVIFGHLSPISWYMECMCKIAFKIILFLLYLDFFQNV